MFTTNSVPIKYIIPFIYYRPGIVHPFVSSRDGFATRTYLYYVNLLRIDSGIYGYQHPWGTPACLFFFFRWASASRLLCFRSLFSFYFTLSLFLWRCLHDQAFHRPTAGRWYPGQYWGVNFGFGNCRSIRNKGPAILDFITSAGIDILGLTETHIRINDTQSFLNDLTPHGRALLHRPIMERLEAGWLSS